MKLDKQIISETAKALGLTEHQVIDIAEDLWNGALWIPFNMDELMHEVSVNFGWPHLNEPQNRPAMEKLINHVRSEFRKHYNKSHGL